MKALKILQENAKILNDCIQIVHETYLEKAIQNHGGKFVGADEEGNLYKGIVCLHGLGTYIVQGIPEVRFSGECLAHKMLANKLH